MNKGKICVSVCAETANKFIEKIKQAVEIADIIELRFDSLKNHSEVGSVLRYLNTARYRIRKKILATFRPRSQGGFRDLELRDRLSFWGETLSDNLFDFADLEFDFKLPKYANKTKTSIIRSFHDFQGIPKDFGEIRKQTGRRPHQILKYAVYANDVFDGLSVIKLLPTHRYRKKPLIPIAMGEAGKWTRILGLAYGSPMTYASLEEGNETAPGQISAKDLIDVYRVKELDETSEIYGVIGNPVSHSLSPYMHNAAFKHRGLNAVYIPFEVANLGEFIKRMVREETREINWNLKGFSVTIPHKEKIIEHLDVIDVDAEKIGAVNTVQIIDGKLYGYNTDARGFIEPLKKSYSDLNGAELGIIGNGGVARACIYILKKHGANVTIFGRNTQKAKLLAEDLKVESAGLSIDEAYFSDFDILVNTTPLGTIGELENQTPATAKQLKNLHLVYDLVYNPIETLFLREAKNVGVPTIGGLEMLVAQGMKQFEIWMGNSAPAKIMSQAALERFRRQ